MKKVELLAPAKDKETAFAAINSGCDAIYIGAKNFGARKKVGNSIKDINLLLTVLDYLIANTSQMFSATEIINFFKEKNIAISSKTKAT